MSEISFVNKAGKVVGKINEETGEETFTEEWLSKSRSASGYPGEVNPDIEEEDTHETDD